MPNSTAITIGLPYDQDYQSQTLMTKWRDHFHKKSQSPKTKLFARALFVFQAGSQYYMTIRYIIPYVFGDYDPWTVYYFKVLASYLAIMSAANWLCVILYDTQVSRSKDRPFPSFHSTRSVVMDGNQLHHGHRNFQMGQNGQHGHNGHCLPDESNHLQSKFCNKCNLQVPPRAHHCNICQSCILKRDHHCYLVGKCIGYKNQRYFVVLAFYSMIVSFWGLYITVVYLRDKWWSAATFSDTILPLTVFRCVFGNITGHVAILVFHCYMLAMFGPIASLYFVSQIIVILKGLTLYELAKNVPVRNTASASKNVQSVFGDFWGFNFIIPAQILFRQKDDGCSWNSVKNLPNPRKDVHHHCQIL